MNYLLILVLNFLFLSPTFAQDHEGVPPGPFNPPNQPDICALMQTNCTNLVTAIKKRNLSACSNPKINPDAVEEFPKFLVLLNVATSKPESTCLFDKQIIKGMRELIQNSWFNKCMEENYGVGEKRAESLKNYLQSIVINYEKK